VGTYPHLGIMARGIFLAQKFVQRDRVLFWTAVARPVLYDARHMDSANEHALPRTEAQLLADAFSRIRVLLDQLKVAATGAERRDLVRQLKTEIEAAKLGEPVNTSIGPLVLSVYPHLVRPPCPTCHASRTIQTAEGMEQETLYCPACGHTRNAAAQHRP
jgi:hypothetical protein